jgi:hypothetical protein
MPSAQNRKQSNQSTPSVSERADKQQGPDNPASLPDLLSLRKRIGACSSESRATERTELEQIWRENRSAWQDLSSQWNPVLEPIEGTVQEMRNAGYSQLVCDIDYIAFAKHDFALYQTVLALSRMGLDKNDWRKKLKSELLPSDRRLDLVRVLAASMEIKLGASQRQAGGIVWSRGIVQCCGPGYTRECTRPTYGPRGRGALTSPH